MKREQEDRNKPNTRLLNEDERENEYHVWAYDKRSRKDFAVMICKAQDTKSIKLRDKEWIEEIEKMSSTYGTTARAMSEEDWQSLKSKMGVEDD